MRFELKIASTCFLMIFIGAVLLFGVMPALGQSIRSLYGVSKLALVMFFGAIFLSIPLGMALDTALRRWHGQLKPPYD